MRYSYVQVAYTISLSKDTEDREYRPLESIKDNYPKYVATADSLLQKRNGIEHINLVDFMRKGKNFWIFNVCVFNILSLSHTLNI